MRPPPFSSTLTLFSLGLPHPSIQEWAIGVQFPPSLDRSFWFPSPPGTMPSYAATSEDRNDTFFSTPRTSLLSIVLLSLSTTFGKLSIIPGHPFPLILRRLPAPSERSRTPYCFFLFLRTQDFSPLKHLGNLAGQEIFSLWLPILPFPPPVSPEVQIYLFIHSLTPPPGKFSGLSPEMTH